VTQRGCLKKIGKAAESDRLPRPEGLAVLRADRRPPPSRRRLHPVEHCGLRRGLIKLTGIASHASPLGVPRLGRVNDKGGLADDFQMHAPVIVDPFRMPRLARQVALGKFGPKPGRFDESGRRDVIGMGVDPIGREEPAGPDPADHAGQRRAGGERRPQLTIWEPEVFPPGDSERRRGRCRFPRPRFPRSSGCRFAVSEVKHSHLEALRQHQRDGAPHTEFGIVGVRSNHEHIEHGGGLRGNATVGRPTVKKAHQTAYSFGMSTLSPDRSPEAQLFDTACGHARRVAVLASVESLLVWDEQTMMPPKAAGYRAAQAEAVATLVHRQRSDSAYGEQLSKLAEGPLAREGDPEVQAAIRLLRKDFDKHVRVPERLVGALAKTCVEAQHAWLTARAQSSWSTLEPWLRQVFDLKKELAAYQMPDADPYDALLDDYEPGGRWQTIAVRFDQLRAELVPLVQACAGAARRPDNAVLRRSYPVADQQRFVRAVASRIGFDFDRGRLDTTEHPFCSGVGPNDCRITTRWDDHSLSCALYGVLHEAGHGLYEQGLPTQWYGMPPGEAASLGIHESQSRLWENLVGRSPAFWEWCFPLAQQAFPGALGDATAAGVQQALMVVQPSLIRVEADEVTYNLHVMMRFDLERAVIHGELAVADLPAAWNERFAKDFGFRPPSDAEGVLQDIHWSAGLIGYFPTYTLGNIFAAQLMAAASQQLPDLDCEIAAGRFGGLLAWLREHVHAHGRQLDSAALVEQATGQPVSERWLVDSLWQRYGAAHGLV